MAILTLKKSKGSKTPGIDGLTLETFLNKHSDILQYISNQISNFVSQPVLIKEIPKLDGSMRKIGIPTIKDRIIQLCFKQILEPICENRFYQNSYGYRPERCAENALAKTYFHINRAKQQYAVSIDIQNFFEIANHSVLLKKCWAIGIKDKRVIRCISLMLHAGISINGKLKSTKLGLFQCGILTPLLVNVYLNSLDWFISKQWETAKTFHTYKESVGHGQSNKIRALRNCTDRLEQYIVRYADDFVVFCPNRLVAEQVCSITKNFLKQKLRLIINDAKCKIINLHKKPLHFLGFKIKAKQKQSKYVVTSHITRKSLDKIKCKLLSKAKQVVRNPNPREAIVYNSMILGILNYYRIATEVNKDLNRLCFQLWRKLKKRCSIGDVRSEFSKLKFPSLKDTSLTLLYIKDVNLYPLYTTHEKPMHKIGEEKSEYRKNVKVLFDKIVDNWSELRYQVYKRDKGICKYSNRFVTLDKFQVHHIIPVKDGGLDVLDNLNTVHEEIHKEIHKSSNLS